MVNVSVSNVELFRTWKDDDEKDLEWILNRILHPEQTEAMKVGEAFHKALELASLGDFGELKANGYSFNVQCECEIEVAPGRELFLAKPYGELNVRGRVDAICGKLITDYKTTSNFDPERLMNGYQWRFYLDMMEVDRFRWEVFVLKDTDDPSVYLVTDHHRLEQARYPELSEDCSKLAAEYLKFAKEYVVPQLSFTPAL